MKPPAFFSYARSDSAFALRLAADLKQGGANVWLDQLDIRPGRKWDIEVEQALHECQEIVVLLSPAATASNNVLDEVAFALEEGKTIIPVKLQNCRIPFRLRRVQYIDFMLSYDEAVKRLLLALAIEGQVQAFETGSGKDRQTSDGIHTGQQDHPSHPAQDSRETHAARSANAQWITEPEAVAPPYNLAENDRSRRQPEGDSNAERTVDNQHAANGPLERTCSGFSYIGL